MIKVSKLEIRGDGSVYVYYNDGGVKIYGYDDLLYKGFFSRSNYYKSRNLDEHNFVDYYKYEDEVNRYEIAHECFADNKEAFLELADKSREEWHGLDLLRYKLIGPPTMSDHIIRESIDQDSYLGVESKRDVEMVRRLCWPRNFEILDEVILSNIFPERDIFEAGTKHRHAIPHNYATPSFPLAVVDYECGIVYVYGNKIPSGSSYTSNLLAVRQKKQLEIIGCIFNEEIHLIRHNKITLLFSSPRRAATIENKSIEPALEIQWFIYKCAKMLHICTWHMFLLLEDLLPEAPPSYRAHGILDFFSKSSHRSLGITQRWGSKKKLGEKYYDE